MLLIENFHVYVATFVYRERIKIREKKISSGSYSLEKNVISHGKIVTSDCKALRYTIYEYIYTPRKAQRKEGAHGL